MKKSTYILKHWKLLLHVLLKTNYFGVNNHWWSKHPSYLGIPWYQQWCNLLLVYPIIQSYYAMKMRALSGWHPNTQAKEWFQQKNSK